MTTKWTSVNLEKKFIEKIKQETQNKPEYSSPKEYIKEAVRQKIRREQNQETQQLLQALDKILKNSNLTKEEIQQMIKKED